LQLVALALLTRLRAGAEQQGRVDSLITIDILRALALVAQGDQPAACEALEPALMAGAPAGYVRRFLDEGAPMKLLIADCRLRGEPTVKAAPILARCSRTSTHCLPLFQAAGHKPDMSARQTINLNSTISNLQWWSR
jgi:MalT-like TPR region